MSIQCTDLRFAKKLLTFAINSDFKDSGITFMNKRIIVNVQFNALMNIPISKFGSLLVEKNYMEILNSEAMKMFNNDKKRLEKFHLKINQAIKDKILTVCNSTPKPEFKTLNIIENLETNNKSFMNILRLPTEMLQKFLLLLDGKTLHKCRQLNTEWNGTIKQIIWSNYSAMKKLRNKVDLNWRQQDFTQSYESIKIEFQFPEIVSVSADSFLIFETLRGYEKYAHYNIVTKELWIIEEPRKVFKVLKSIILINFLTIY